MHQSVHAVLQRRRFNCPVGSYRGGWGLSGVASYRTHSVLYHPVHTGQDRTGQDRIPMISNISALPISAPPSRPRRRPVDGGGFRARVDRGTVQSSPVEDNWRRDESVNPTLDLAWDGAGRWTGQEDVRRGAV
jgi:hypothetical protein